MWWPNPQLLLHCLQCTQCFLVGALEYVLVPVAKSLRVKVGSIPGSRIRMRHKAIFLKAVSFQFAPGLGRLLRVG